MQRVVLMVRSLMVLMLFHLLGVWVVSYFSLNLPGSICGLLMLLVFLVLRGGVSPLLQQTSDTLFAHLPLFLIPGTVGIVSWWPLLANKLPELGLILLVSFTLTYFFAFAVMTLLMRRSD